MKMATESSSVKAALVSLALTFTASANAAGTWLNDDNMLDPGTTIQAIAANSNKNSYTGNPALTNRAWGMQGTWLSFEVEAPADVLVSLSSAATNAPGFTVYRTDGPFTGNGTGTSEKNGTAGAIHSFNQVAQAGDPGIVWATDNDVSGSLEGNTTENGIVETLGYVNGSGMDYVNFYGYEVAAGAHDLSVDNKYENGVFGSVDRFAGANGDTNYAILTLVNLQPGYYTIFLGGTDTGGSDTPIDVKVSAIPLSPADCLLNWEEENNPELYPRNSESGATGLISQTILQYYVRYYAETDTYLGISSNNHLYSLGPDDPSPVDLGASADLMPESCQ